MKKSVLFSGLLAALWVAGCSSPQPDGGRDCASYVNPFIGTAYNGHTFPGACLPFGLIQTSPETGIDSWKYCSGYNSDDDSIIGFAQTHLNGTGCADLGDVLLLPFSGETRRKSAYDKASQQASPGYYAVRLTDSDVDVELTATPHTAFHRYVYRSASPARLLVDLQSGVTGSAGTVQRRVLQSDVQMPDNHTLTGSQVVNCWVKRRLHFALTFDRPFTVVDTLPAAPAEKGMRLVLGFNLAAGDTLMAKVALSAVDVDGALAALQAENPGWDFGQVSDRARRAWNDLLARVQVKGTDGQKTSFYTSLYHLFIQPNNIADVDGRYRASNDSVMQAPGGAYYSTLSLWDTYRAAHPLYTLLCPERVDALVQGMLAHHHTAGHLPVWTLWDKETYCMIGNHAIPVIVDAYLKGFSGFDAEEAYRAIRETSTVNHRNSDWETYDRYGYYPFDVVKDESVSRTLESAYDDYCVALMAKALGKDEDYAYFMRRASYWKNLVDPETRLMRGKDSQGHWRTPFNPFLLAHASSVGGDYTEGNAWQYTWHVQHDVEGLMEAMGGKEAFAAKLDSLFVLEAPEESTGFVSDVTGLIGQYAHGNEPSHHVVYLYNYAGQPEKTQRLVREIFDRFYLPEPDGLCGNDDCGQMSAWYVFSAMGFYPVDPVSGEYVLGAPQVPEVSLSLPGGKTFTVRAEGLSEQNRYVRSVTFNGRRLEGFKIRHADVVNGGELVFEMAGE